MFVVVVVVERLNAISYVFDATDVFALLTTMRTWFQWRILLAIIDMDLRIDEPDTMKFVSVFFFILPRNDVASEFRLPLNYSECQQFIGFLEFQRLLAWNQTSLKYYIIRVESMKCFQGWQMDFIDQNIIDITATKAIYIWQRVAKNGWVIVNNRVYDSIKFNICCTITQCNTLLLFSLFIRLSDKKVRINKKVPGKKNLLRSFCCCSHSIWKWLKYLS